MALPNQDVSSVKVHNPDLEHEDELEMGYDGGDEDDSFDPPELDQAEVAMPGEDLTLHPNPERPNDETSDGKGEVAKFSSSDPQPTQSPPCGHAFCRECYEYWARYFNNGHVPPSPPKSPVDKPATPNAPSHGPVQQPPSPVPRSANPISSDVQVPVPPQPGQSPEHSGPPSGPASESPSPQSPISNLNPEASIFHPVAPLSPLPEWAPPQPTTQDVYIGPLFQIWLRREIEDNISDLAQGPPATRYFMRGLWDDVQIRVSAWAESHRGELLEESSLRNQLDEQLGWVPRGFQDLDSRTVEAFEVNREILIERLIRAAEFSWFKEQEFDIEPDWHLSY